MNAEFVSPLYGSVNFTLGEKEERIMMTGLHTVADIFCVSCGSIVGWKYVRCFLRNYVIWYLQYFDQNDGCLKLFLWLSISGVCT